ncbi:Hypothetical predicted protein [Pelobates cultripes]|uniref:Uncharacterized protein n=1 Tax=Pelobates cultripes TaxID=61616 RepID=A0AAD1R6R7_PELCU|nr:Hypothetical predicted protein [Pelobates cultripes]
MKAQIRPLVESGEYAELLEKMERRIKDLEENIRETKRKKILRDQADYKAQIQRNWKSENKPRYQSPIREIRRPKFKPQQHKTYKDALTFHQTPKRTYQQYHTDSRPTYQRRYDNPNNRYQQRNTQRNTGYTNYQNGNTHQKRFDNSNERYHNTKRDTTYHQDKRRTNNSTIRTEVIHTPRTYNERNVHAQSPIKMNTTTTTVEHKRTISQDRLPPSVPNLATEEPQYNINTENDFLEKRGRVPPRRFSMEDFPLPQLRRKRTLRDIEEGIEQIEDLISQKRKK